MGSVGGRVAEVLSPVVFPSAVFVPSAVFRVGRVVVVPSRAVGGRAVVGVRVGRVVVVADRAAVAVAVVAGVAGRVRAGVAGHLAVYVMFLPVFVRKRSGERNG